MITQNKLVTVSSNHRELFTRKETFHLTFKKEIYLVPTVHDFRGPGCLSHLPALLDSVEMI